MAIYSSDEFDKIKCSKCGNEVFYTKKFTTLKKEAIKPNNFAKQKIIEINSTVIRVCYYCAECNNLIATYIPNKNNGQWSIV